eukprot:418706_1
MGQTSTSSKSANTTFDIGDTEYCYNSDTHKSLVYFKKWLMNERINFCIFSYIWYTGSSNGIPYSLIFWKEKCNQHIHFTYNGIRMNVECFKQIPTLNYLNQKLMDNQFSFFSRFQVQHI